MNPVEQELLTLAQIDVEHQQHLRWDDLRRAVVLHLDELPHEPFRIQQRVYKNEICPDLLENKPCAQWKTGTACNAKWLFRTCSGCFWGILLMISVPQNILAQGDISNWLTSIFLLGFMSRLLFVKDECLICHVL